MNNAVSAVLEEAFRLFDKDGDGNITSTELQSVMNSLGQPVDLRQASEMIMSVDKDGTPHTTLIAVHRADMICGRPSRRRVSQRR